MQLIWVFIWFVGLEALSLITFLAFHPLFKHLKDQGTTISKPLGLIWFGLITWWFSFFDLSQSYRPLIPFFALSIQFFIGFLIYVHRIRARKTNRARIQLRALFSESPLYIEFAFLFIFALLTTIRAFHPEITWGEKPMDSTFFHYFSRMPLLPPTDPWAAGEPMRYHYLGTYILSAFSTLTFVPVGVGYNLSVVTVFSLVGITLFGILINLGVRSRWSMLAVLTFLFSSNFETLRRLWVENEFPDFQLFWKTSRVLQEPSFSEYPIWSFLFNDLHAHVVGYMTSLTFLSLSIARQSIPNTKNHRFSWAALLGTSYCVLLTVNVWDALTHIWMFPVLFFLCRTQRQNSGSKTVAPFSASDLATAILFGLTTISPFLLDLRFDSSKFYGIFQGPHNNLDQILRFNGHWSLPAILLNIGVILSTFPSGSTRICRMGLVKNKVCPMSLKQSLCTTKLNLIQVGLLVSVLIVVAIAGEGDNWISCFKSTMAKPKSLFIYLSISGLTGAIGLANSRLSPQLRFSSAFLFLASVLTLACEFLHLIDRMNLVFKTTVTINTFLALSTLLSLLFYPRNFRKLKHAVAIPVILWIICFGFGGYSLIQIMMKHYHQWGPRPNLDGKKFLNSKNSDEAQVFDWVMKNISGTPVAIEAPGGYFNDRARFSMYTGLPIILGWEHHVNLRGTAREKLDRRRSEVDEIYSTSDPVRALNLLKKYKTEYLYLGRIERSNYPPSGTSKFYKHSSFEPIVRTKGATLFRIKSP